MTREQAVKILLGFNPPERRQVIEMYVSSFLGYVEAQENIDRNGNIVAHPRTGAPMENPYLKVRTACLSDMNKLKLKGLALWAQVKLGGGEK